MQLGDKLAEYIKNFSSYRTTMDFGDVAEILIIAVLLYYALVWMKTTRAWVLLKGLVVILIFLLLAYFFRMTTILWMAQNVLGFAVTAPIVVLQPELRKALEELGKKNIISSVLPFDNNHRVDEGFSEKTINEITKACVEIGKDIIPILDYYESRNAVELTKKIQSIPAFHGVKAPMTRRKQGWIPDFSSRYFTEDVPLGTKPICCLAEQLNIPVPTLQSFVEWNTSILNRFSPFRKK